MTSQPSNVCDSVIFENGRTICVLSGASTVIEALVVRVREELKIKIDWHYIGGRANILTTELRELDERTLEWLRMSMPIWLSPDPVKAER